MSTHRSRNKHSIDIYKSDFEEANKFHDDEGHVPHSIVMS